MHVDHAFRRYSYFLEAINALAQFLRVALASAFEYQGVKLRFLCLTSCSLSKSLAKSAARKQHLQPTTHSVATGHSQCGAQYVEQPWHNEDMTADISAPSHSLTIYRHTPLSIAGKNSQCEIGQCSTIDRCFLCVLCGRFLVCTD